VITTSSAAAGVDVPEGCPQLDAFASREYGPCDTDGGAFCKTNSLEIDPWFFAPETSTTSAAGKAGEEEEEEEEGAVVTLGRYKTNGISAATTGPAALVWAQRTAHRVLFSGSTRLPSEVWKAVAAAAGVHLFSTDSPAAAVDVGGNALTVHINQTLDSPFTPGGSDLGSSAQDDSVVFDDGDKLCTIQLPRVFGKVVTVDGEGKFNRVICLACDSFVDCDGTLNGTKLYFLFDQ
jgi:hypothetical protein